MFLFTTNQYKINTIGKNIAKSIELNSIIYVHFLKIAEESGHDRIKLYDFLLTRFNVTSSRSAICS